MPNMVETERFFPVKGETHICFFIYFILKFSPIHTKKKYIHIYIYIEYRITEIGLEVY